jgi:hypothetical protein
MQSIFLNYFLQNKKLYFSGPTRMPGGLAHKKYMLGGPA